MVSLTKNNEIVIFPTSYDLFQFAAKDFENRAIVAIKDKGVFSVVLSGGNTPKLFFDNLVNIEYYKKNIPWQQIQFFFGDERYVPSDDKNSNYHMAYEFLFSKVPINPENIYRIPTEFNNPKEAATDYEKTLRKVFQIKDHAFPPFDLSYLGLGDDGHTASLMPLSDIVMHYANYPSLNKNTQLVESLFVSKLNMHRISLTPNALNNSKNIIFLVTGETKATAVHEVIEGKPDPQHYPAQLIQCVSGKTIWYLDPTAAEKLSIANNPYRT